jgi:hypothetical protein
MIRVNVQRGVEVRGLTYFVVIARARLVTVRSGSPVS